jgi:hypothetical protein
MDRPMLASLVAKSIWKMRAKPELPGTYKPYSHAVKPTNFSFFSFLSNYVGEIWLSLMNKRTCGQPLQYRQESRVKFVELDESQFIIGTELSGT